MELEEYPSAVTDYGKCHAKFRCLNLRHVLRIHHSRAENSFEKFEKLLWGARTSGTNRVVVEEEYKSMHRTTVGYAFQTSREERVFLSCIVGLYRLRGSLRGSVYDFRRR